MLNTVNFPSSRHCRDLKLVSSLPRVRNSESLYFQAKRVKFIFACDFAAIYIIGVCVIAGCLLGKKEMIFQQKLFLKVLFHCQSDQSGQGSARQFSLLESALSVGLSWLRVFL